VYAGAGTVMSVAQVEAAAAAGARYIVSPNVDEAVIRRTVALGMLSIPGALTPSEIAAAYGMGAAFVKLFPASELGPSYIRAVRSPISHIPLLAVGGITCDNMAEYLKAGICGFGIGGNIVDMKLVNAGDYAGLTALAQRYTDRIREIAG
jgi:2-dehydro-3-deoxyphosphogluconate aldolase/(4S)-4-hydroxy-2-oxoglutarate aldolase